MPFSAVLFVSNIILFPSSPLRFRKNMQRNKQVAMGRKKFNMDPKKVGGRSRFTIAA